MAQDTREHYEIIVLDNDPDSQGALALISEVPELRERNFSYFVNAENIGMFGNFNRSIQLARGEWLTILNDDDLLDVNYLTLMLSEISRDVSIDGIICGKRTFSTEQLHETKTVPEVLVELGSWWSRCSRIMTKRRLSKLYWRTRGRLSFEMLYLGQNSRFIPVRKLFWGTILGNGAGFLFRREKALVVGGFYPEEYPSADFGFFVRFSKIAHLRQHRAVAASMRKSDSNATLTTVSEALKQGSRIQKSMIGNEVPNWYRHILPFSLAHDRVDFRNIWGVDIPQAEIEEAVQMKLPAHRPGLISQLRFWLRGR